MPLSRADLLQSAHCLWNDHTKACVATGAALAVVTVGLSGYLLGQSQNAVPVAASTQQPVSASTSAPTSPAVDAPALSTQTANLAPAPAGSTDTSPITATPQASSDVLVVELSLVSQGRADNNQGAAPIDELCQSGALDFEDVAVGRQLTLKDGSGALAGVGALDTAHFEPTGAPHQVTDALTGEVYESTSGICVFESRLVVESNASFYTLEMGERGSWAVSRSQLEADGWRLKLQV